MKKIIFINSVFGVGSTGKIVKNLSYVSQKSDFDCYSVYGREKKNEGVKEKYIGNTVHFYTHIFFTRLFDKHGRCSFFITKKIIKHIDSINPDIIHLHNIHGYYLNYEMLFKYLKSTNVPIIWTFHDCWPYTGHCAYYSYLKCDKWKVDGCKKCISKKSYPSCYLFSNSKNNYILKKNIFSNVNKMTIVTPSEWLQKEVSQSFFSKYPCYVINNGIDLNVFFPKNAKKRFDKKVILGVANVWEPRKGLQDFYKLSDLLPEDYLIVLIGLSEKQITQLNSNMCGIKRTANQIELAELYSEALCFVNPTYEDNFPTTNLEALACGTPVITYNTGGSPEAVDENTGFVVDQGSVEKICDCIKIIDDNGKDFYKDNCVLRAKSCYNQEDNYMKYVELYNEVLS